MLILVSHSPVLPEFVIVPPELQILNESATFTFNCTPSENGYPAMYMYVFQSDKLMSNNVKVDTLKEGEFYNVTVTATNMIGPSETFQTSFTVNSKMSSENYVTCAHMC